ncbi:MAG TPA: hypothetical protein PKW56_06180 [Clostridiales bacterium]|nr:hypothetical protein [Clostridiales bacterium]
MKNYTLIKLIVSVSVLLALNSVFAKEITDDLGKTCHTFKVNEDMVEFLRIRGSGVLMYKESNMAEPLLPLLNKTFVQYLDRSGRNVKVLAYDGINPPVEGWLTKFNVESKNDIFNYYYGEPFTILIEAEDSDEVKDVPVDKIVWITKNVTKLYYEPSHTSDYKYEIYFGLKMEAKKQRGDFYYVLIYNSIFQEYRNGWVKVDDCGTYEYFSKEFEKRKIDYDRELAGIDTKINEMEQFVMTAGTEIKKAETERFRLIAQRNILKERVNLLKMEKLALEDEETRKAAEEIATLESRLDELKKLDNEIGDQILKLETTMKRSFSDIDINTDKAEKLKLALENMKMGRYEAAESMLQITPREEAEEMIEEETVELDQETVEEKEDECAPIKDKLDRRMAEFEKVRSDMTGRITREEYNRLYDQYMKIWSDINAIKNDFSKCETYSRNKHIALYNDALSLKKEEEYDDALDLLIEAVELKPDFDEGYFQIVTILIGLDEDDEAGDYIEKISDGEKKGKLYYKRALSVKDNYPGKAIRYFEKMADLYKPELAYYYIGIAYSEKLSDQENAIRNFRKSLDIDPEDPKVLEAAGAAYMELKPRMGQEKNANYNLALSYLEKAARNSDKYSYANADVLNARLSQVYNILGRFSSALKHGETALNKARFQPFGIAHLEIGKALISLDRKNEALDHLKEAAKDISTKTEAEYWIKETGN